MSIHGSFIVGSVVLAIAAAGLWFWSAVLSLPSQFAITVVKPGAPFGETIGAGMIGASYVGHGQSKDLNDLGTALKRQSRLSACAAICAALSALAQAASMIW